VPSFLGGEASGNAEEPDANLVPLRTLVDLKRAAEILVGAKVVANGEVLPRLAEFEDVGEVEMGMRL